MDIYLRTDDSRREIHRPDEEDVCDTLTLLKDLEIVDGGAPGAIALRRLAEAGAQDRASATTSS